MAGSNPLLLDDDERPAGVPLVTWLSSLVAAAGLALTSILVSGFTSAFLFFTGPAPHAPAAPSAATTSDPSGR